MSKEGRSDSFKKEEVEYSVMVQRMFVGFWH
jgi:hypothetical protein